MNKVTPDLIFYKHILFNFIFCCCSGRSPTKQELTNIYVYYEVNNLQLLAPNIKLKITIFILKKRKENQWSEGGSESISSTRSIFPKV